MTVNKVTLVGNLGRDAEIRNTNTGTPIANLRLATTDRRKAPDGTWQDHTEWHAVVAFGKTAVLTPPLLSISLNCLVNFVSRSCNTMLGLAAR